MRLLDLNPNDQMARQGLVEISERFAFLAEKELAESNNELAVGYINLGLQINPENKVLKDIYALTSASKHSFFDRLMSFFSTDQ